MRVYDTQGRLCVAVSFAVTDVQFIKRDLSDTIAGDRYTFSNAGSNLRINNGKLELSDDTTGLWYAIGLTTQDEIRTLYIADNPST